jgi:hypothetical protein
MNGSLQLSEYLGDLVRLSCEKCGHSGQYRNQKLIERYGADIRPPDMRQEIAKCRRHGDKRTTPEWFVMDTEIALGNEKPRQLPGRVRPS